MCIVATTEQRPETSGQEEQSLPKEDYNQLISERGSSQDFANT